MAANKKRLTKQSTLKAPAVEEVSKPQTKVRISFRKYAYKFGIASAWYTGLTACAAGMFYHSAALTHWLQLKDSLGNLAQATPYVPGVTLAVLVLMFAAFGFVVCFPRFKLLFTAGIPALLSFLYRQGGRAGSLIMIWAGSAGAMILGESLRLGQAVDIPMVLNCFLAGLGGDCCRRWQTPSMSDFAFKAILTKWPRRRLSQRNYKRLALNKPRPRPVGAGFDATLRGQAALNWKSRKPPTPVTLPWIGSQAETLCKLASCNLAATCQLRHI